VLKEYDYIFNPRSIAIIGASHTDDFTRSLTKTEKTRNNLFLVNPNHKELFGKKCYPSILDIAEQVDYVVIAVSALLVPQVLRDCIEKGVIKGLYREGSKSSSCLFFWLQRDWDSRKDKIRG